MEHHLAVASTRQQHLEEWCRQAAYSSRKLLELGLVSPETHATVTTILHTLSQSPVETTIERR